MAAWFFLAEIFWVFGPCSQKEIEIIMACLSVFAVVAAEIPALSLDVSDLYIVIPLTLVRLNYLFVYKLSVVEVVKLEDQQPPSVLLVVPSMSRSS